MRIGRGPLIVIVGVVAATCLFAARAATADAHPLGNFTINHYDRVSVSASGIEVFSVLDMAEIPAFTARQQIDRNGDGAVDAAESEAYAKTQAAALRDHLVLRVDGRDVPLSGISHAVAFPEGQGGLALLRLTATYRADLRGAVGGAQTGIEFENRNDVDRIGWREIVVRAAGGVRIDGSSVSSQDQSAELTAYPEDGLSSPPDIRRADFSYSLIAGAAADPPTTPQAVAVRGNQDASLSRFSDLISADHLSPGVVIIALLAAMGFGAVHALSPGHGKTIVAAYLVGSKGTARHALLLGLTVTLTHTSSVYALGFIALYLSEYIVPEKLYPWLGVTSGALIVVMGMALVIGRARSSGVAARMAASLRRFAPGRPSLVLATELGAFQVSRADLLTTDDHDRAHAIGAEHQHERDAGHEHEHAGEHRHAFGAAHSHTMPGADGEPVTWRRLVGLGVFGGMLPCPSAIVVMLSAISLHRVGFGLVLILAFSFGLAAVLTGIGFALVFGRQLMERVPGVRTLTSRTHGGGWASTLVRYFPLASAMAVVIAGTLVAMRAYTQI